MGIDIQGLKLLNEARRRGNFGKTLTIGRQGLHAPKHVIESIFQTQDFEMSEYSENLFIRLLGSTTVHSVDISSFEGATIKHDLNEPIPEGMGKFDSIFDGGCLEHIFHINQALLNISKLCNVGGQIIHVLPANNQCGHGFYQFSPELFFSLYSEKNGYKDTEVYIGDTSDPNFTVRLTPPAQGERNNIYHPNSLYVLVRTVLAREDFSHKNVQQSDYAYIWSKNENV